MHANETEIQGFVSGQDLGLARSFRRSGNKRLPTPRLESDGSGTSVEGSMPAWNFLALGN